MESSGQSFENVNFEELSNKIQENYAEHEKNIKEHCVKSSISLSDFYDGFQQGILEMDSEPTPTKDQRAFAEYADTFKIFEEYPANMQKLRKTSPKELQRRNSSILKAALPAPDGTSFGLKDSCSASICLSQSDESMSAVDTYNNFKKFKQKLHQLSTELEQHKLGADYATKLRQLKVFSQQLEKLLPTEEVQHRAFSDEEESALQHLLQNMKEFNFINVNRDLFQNEVQSNGRFDSLVDILTYTLISMNCLNKIYSN